jgi:hypothetical protein
MHWKEAHAGHYIKRGYLGTFVDERNVRPQCPGCNTYRGGVQDEFGLNLTKEYGPGILDELNTLKHANIKYSRSDYLEMIEKVKEQIEELDRRIAA